MLSRPGIDGIEVHWFAQDSIGQVAAFISAGSCVVPEAVVNNLDEHRKAADLIQKWGVSTEVRTRLLGSKKGIWRTYAQRGLFAFDFFSFDSAGMLNGEYTLEAEPVAPLRIEQVSDPSARSLFRTVAFRTSVFSKKLNVDIELLKQEGLPLLKPLI
jgi:hypothetical protein